MVGHDFFSLVEPVGRDLIQHPAFIRDAARQHHIEGGQPVGSDNQELFSQVVSIPYLAFDKNRQG